MASHDPKQRPDVGAGLSGLAAAEVLRRRGIAVSILEAHNHVAEPWRRRHPALRLNIHRHFARLPEMSQIIGWRGKPLAIRVDNGPKYISATLFQA